MNVPLSDLALRSTSLPANALTIVYDQSGATATLTAATAALRTGGVASVYAMRGGLDAWNRAFGDDLVVRGDSVWGSFAQVSVSRVSAAPKLDYLDTSTIQGWYTVFVDVRDATAYAAGHLAGAVNVSEAGAANYVSALPRNVAVVIISDDGTASDRVAAGFRGQRSKVWSLLGGMAEWTKQQGSFLVVTSAG
ncbi:MAG: rhodanese-like domain-containing protein, partial [Candidatus Bipolaricaulota bacterium]